MTELRSIDEEIEAWRREATEARTREIAIFALGASAGLRWAKERFEPLTLREGPSSG